MMPTACPLCVRDDDATLWAHTRGEHATKWVAWLNGPAHVVDELAPTVPLCGAPAGMLNVYDAASNRKRCPKCVVLTSSGKQRTGQWWFA
jgi:hypothetical protein